MAFFPSTLSYTNLFFVDSSDPLTGHSNFPYSLHVFVARGGLTFCDHNVLLPSTDPFNDVYLNFCNLLHLSPIVLLPLAYSAQRSPLIYPANWIRSAGWPRHILCYKIDPNVSGLWCQDATPQPAGGDPLFQRHSQRRVLYIFFEVHAHQGSVTLPRISLQGV